MRRCSLALIGLVLLAGCNSSTSSIGVGDEVTFSKSLAPDGKRWLPIDEASLLELGKPPAEFDKVFDQLVDDQRIFLENDTARAVVLSTKSLRGHKVAKLRITEGMNPNKETWTLVANLVPLPKR